MDALSKQRAIDYLLKLLEDYGEEDLEDVNNAYRFLIDIMRKPDEDSPKRKDAKDTPWRPTRTCLWCGTSYPAHALRCPSCLTLSSYHPL
jgi:hypothetical protein